MILNTFRFYRYVQNKMWFDDPRGLSDPIFLKNLPMLLLKLILFQKKTWTCWVMMIGSFTWTRRPCWQRPLSGASSTSSVRASTPLVRGASPMPATLCSSSNLSCRKDRWVKYKSDDSIQRRYVCMSNWENFITG